MPGYAFIIKNDALPRTTAIAGFPTEAFSDVRVEFGQPEWDGAQTTYMVKFRSNSPRSLEQATTVFRNLAERQRAIFSEGKID